MKKSRGIWSIIPVIALVLILCFVGLQLFAKSDSGNQYAENTSATTALTETTAMTESESTELGITELGTTTESATQIETTAEPKTTEVTTTAAEPKTTEATTTTAEPKTTVAETTTAKEVKIDKNKNYTKKDDVALYLYTYGCLPDNFMTKKEAQALGWSGGGLDNYKKNACIGGDKFGNFEGILPTAKGRQYYECDIDTMNKKSRGAKRLVFSNDGLIYYTEDHYSSFELLYDDAKLNFK